jgi:hypothetical protein
MPVFIEWGGYEVYAGIAAQLGTTALATQSVLNILVRSIFIYTNFIHPIYSFD